MYLYVTDFRPLIPSQLLQQRCIRFFNMNRMRRIAGIGKAKVPPAVQMDKDESVVFFRELYKREKDKDVNLLEPMYSVEFEAIQGELFGCGDPFSCAYFQDVHEHIHYRC